MNTAEKNLLLSIAQIDFAVESVDVELIHFYKIYFVLYVEKNLSQRIAVLSAALCTVGKYIIGIIKAKKISKLL